MSSTTSSITRYRIRRVEIYAIRFDGTNHEAIHAFAPGCFEEINPENRGDDPDVVATVWNQHYGVRLPVKVGRWIARNQHSFFTIRAERMDEYEAIDEPETFTWGQSIGMTGDTVDIPFNDGDTWVGNVLVGKDDVVVLRDMLNGVLDETALEHE